MNELEKIFLAFHVNGTYEYALDYVWFRTYRKDYIDSVSLIIW